MNQYRMPWDRFPSMRRLLAAMKAMDLKYHQIGKHGLYWRLRAAGACNSAILSDQEIREAMNRPPSGTRAHARAMAIREVWPDAKARANWALVVGRKGSMPLNDPFASTGCWKQPEAAKKAGRGA